MIGGDLIECGGLLHGKARVIHKGLRLYQKHAVRADRCFGAKRVKLGAVDANAATLCQVVYRQKARVVSGEPVFVAGISQAYDQPGDRLLGGLLLPGDLFE